MADLPLALTLHNPEQAKIIIRAQLMPAIDAGLAGGKRLELTLNRVKRSGGQNRRYWGRGVLAQVAEQAVVGGRMYDAEIWHEQFKRRFIGVQELPDGSVVGMSSAKLSTAAFAAFCGEVEAYAASELDVRFVDLPAA